MPDKCDEVLRQLTGMLNDKRFWEVPKGMTRAEETAWRKGVSDSMRLVSECRELVRGAGQ